MATEISARPRQYWENHASRFKNKSLADAYGLRPPYPEETYDILRGLLGESSGRVLDAGCGPGKIARLLVDYTEGVDAIDFSQEMIRVGKSLRSRDHFLPLGDKLTSPVRFSQSIRDYVGSFHSRESLSVEHMGADNAAAFDARLSSILLEYADEAGILSFDLQTRVSWGRPRA